MAITGIINRPDVAGTASVSRTTAEMSGAIAPTVTDKQNTMSSDASSTSMPWLGGSIEAKSLDSTRDGPAVLLLLPIITNTQKATAWPVTQRSDFVSRTGRGTASAPKTVPGLGVQDMRNNIAGSVGAVRACSKGDAAAG